MYVSCTVNSSVQYSSPSKIPGLLNMLKLFHGNPKELPKHWLDRLKSITDKHGLVAKEKLLCARLLLQGKAAIWYSAHKKSFSCWDDFQSQFLRRFAINGQAAASALLGRFQYENEPVGVYAASIHYLHDSLLQSAEKPVPDCFLKTLFINGLHPNLREKVMFRRPKTLQDAVGDAVFFEQCLHGEQHVRQPFSNTQCPPVKSNYFGKQPSYPKTKYKRRANVAPPPLPRPQPQPQPPPAPHARPQAAPTSAPHGPATGPASSAAPRATGRSHMLKVATTSMDPFDQLMSLPMRSGLSLEGYIKTCSDATFQEMVHPFNRLREDR